MSDNKHNEFSNTPEQTGAPAEPTTDSSMGEQTVGTDAHTTEAQTDTAATPEAAGSVESTNESQAGTKNLLILAAVLIAIAAVIFAGYYYYSNDGGETSGIDMESSMTGDQAGQQQNVAELFTLPESDSAVAMVNGESLPASQFNSQVTQAAQQAQTQGADLSNEETRAGIKEQALDMMINTELLLQAADESDVTVEEGAVDAEVERIRSGFDTEEAFQTQLGAANTTIEELETNLAKDLRLQAYLDEAIPMSEFSVTDAEVESFYQEAAAGNPNVPALEEVRDQVEQQVQTQKRQAAIQEMLTGLRADAEIERMVDLGDSTSS